MRRACCAFNNSGQARQCLAGSAVRTPQNDAAPSDDQAGSSGGAGDAIGPGYLAMIVIKRAKPKSVAWRRW